MAHMKVMTWTPDSLKEEGGRFVGEDEEFVSDLLP